MEGYAKRQGACYDENKHEILYGISDKMKGFGIGNGTCNLISPYMINEYSKCGAGVSGGNPDYNKTVIVKNKPQLDINPITDNLFGNNATESVENFETLKPYNVTSIVNILLCILLIFLLCKLE
jgi:hypothetical protein